MTSSEVIKEIAEQVREFRNTHKRLRMITIDRLEKLCGYRRWYAVQAGHLLTRSGEFRFIPGRKGGVSRIVWDLPVAKETPVEEAGDGGTVGSADPAPAMQPLIRELIWKARKEIAAAAGAMPDDVQISVRF